jgi:hypothetical protein
MITRQIQTRFLLRISCSRMILGTVISKKPLREAMLLLKGPFGLYEPAEQRNPMHLEKECKCSQYKENPSNFDPIFSSNSVYAS